MGILRRPVIINDYKYSTTRLVVVQQPELFGSAVFSLAVMSKWPSRPFIEQGAYLRDIETQALSASRTDLSRLSDPPAELFQIIEMLFERNILPLSYSITELTNLINLVGVVNLPRGAKIIQLLRGLPFKDVAMEPITPDKTKLELSFDRTLLAMDKATLSELYAPQNSWHSGLAKA